MQESYDYKSLSEFHAARELFQIAQQMINDFWNIPVCPQFFDLHWNWTDKTFILVFLERPEGTEISATLPYGYIIIVCIKLI